jgi:hypothetical protein
MISIRLLLFGLPLFFIGLLIGSKWVWGAGLLLILLAFPVWFTGVLSVFRDR